MHHEIVRHQIMLERLFAQANKLQRNVDIGSEIIDSEVVSHFVSYLCVRTSGFVEFSVKTILREYASASTNEPRLMNLVDSRLKRTLNPSKGAIVSLAGEFGTDWSQNLKREIEGELDNSLEDIVRKRNDISHGKNVDLSLNDLEIHFKNAKQVVEIIHRQCVANENQSSIPMTTR